MISFHGDLKIKKKYVNRVKNHIKLDHLIRGQGWTGEKGCAVGCTLESYDHNRYETELGIPEWLARVEDALFEGMSVEKSKTWPLVFLQSIKPGVDLEKAKSKFLIIVLESALASFDHKKFPDVKKCINQSISLWKREDIGSKDWNKVAARASEAAEAAARAEAWAAARAAEAAARAEAWAPARAAEAAARAEAWAEAWAAAWAAEAAARAEAWAAARAEAWAAAWAARAEARAEAWAAEAVGVPKYDYFADELIKILKSLK